MSEDETNRLIHSQILGRDTYFMNGIRVAITENDIDSEGRFYNFAIVYDPDRKSHKLGNNLARVSYDPNEKQGNQRVDDSGELIKIVIGCGNKMNLFLDQVSRRRDAASRVIKLISKD